MPIRASINREELSAALKPLCDLLGTSPKNFYDSPGMKIGDGEITFLVPVRHEDDPTGRAVSTPESVGDVPSWTLPQQVDVDAVLVGQPDVREWAFPVRVEVRP